MKAVTILLLLLLASSAYGQLTKEDLRTIMKEENAALEKRMKEYIDLKIDGVEKSLNARIDGVEKSLNARIDVLDKSLNARIDATNARIDALDKSLNARIDGTDARIDDFKGSVNLMWLTILALVAAAVALPQVIIILIRKLLVDKPSTINRVFSSKLGFSLTLTTWVMS